MKTLSVTECKTKCMHRKMVGFIKQSKELSMSDRINLFKQRKYDYWEFYKFVNIFFFYPQISLTTLLFLLSIMFLCENNPGAYGDWISAYAPILAHLSPFFPIFGELGDKISIEIISGMETLEFLKTC